MTDVCLSPFRGRSQSTNLLPSSDLKLPQGYSPRHAEALNCRPGTVYWASTSVWTPSNASRNRNSSQINLWELTKYLKLTVQPCINIWGSSPHLWGNRMPPIVIHIRKIKTASSQDHEHRGTVFSNVMDLICAGLSLILCIQISGKNGLHIRVTARYCTVNSAWVKESCIRIVQAINKTCAATTTWVTSYRDRMVVVWQCAGETKEFNVCIRLHS